MMKRPIPPTLVLAFLIGVLADVINLANVRLELDGAVRWHLLALGLNLTEGALLAVGLFELAHRVTGPAHLALRAAAWCATAIALWAVARPMVEVVFERSDRMIAVWRWTFAATGVLGLGIAIGLVRAARGFARVPVAAALVIVSVLARGWVPYLADDLHRWMWEHRTLGLVYWLGVGLLWSGGGFWLVWTIVGDAIAPSADSMVAARGFRLVAGALRFRIIAAIVIAVSSLGMSSSPAMTKLVIIGGPLFALLTMVAGAVGVLTAARGWLDGMPRYRLAVGATLTLWWAAVQLEQLAWVMRAFGQSSFGEAFGDSMIESWTILGPLIAAAGLALVGSAVSAYAAARPHDELRETATVRTLMFVVLSASTVAIQSQLFKVTTRDSFLMLALLAAGAGIGALVSLVGLFTRAAEAVTDGPTLPPARVVDST